MKDKDLLYYRPKGDILTVDITDADSVEIRGYSLYIYKNSLASQLKAIIDITPYQWRKLIRELVSDGVDIEDWSCVDLSGCVD